MTTYFHFRVSIDGIKPAIERSFLLTKSASFYDLHMAIQDAFGWQNYHLFAFRVDPRGDVLAGIAEPGEPDPDARKVRLTALFGKRGGTRCLYQYDFGDDWWHVVEFEGELELPGRQRRVLLDGKRSCPPEDCGGVYGYSRAVAAATGKRWRAEFGDAEERRAIVEWLGGWKPDDFDLAKARSRFDE
ncbi:MAG: plasmid pRiA4b ORF-3 family protein [Planctomycetes bacterium]|nr:plasmid pRiA4b ORF-3 family protein [Planctomycetota bacterium]